MVLTLFAQFVPDSTVLSTFLATFPSSGARVFPLLLHHVSYINCLTCCSSLVPIFLISSSRIIGIDLPLPNILPFPGTVAATAPVGGLSGISGDVSETFYSDRACGCFFFKAHLGPIRQAVVEGYG